MIQPLGVITSPGFPQPYSHGIDCTWNIQLQIGQLIQFNFSHFDIAELLHPQPLPHGLKYVYGTPEKMSAAFPILKLYNFNISIL